MSQAQDCHHPGAGKPPLHMCITSTHNTDHQPTTTVVGWISTTYLPLTQETGEKIK